MSNELHPDKPPLVHDPEFVYPATVEALSRIAASLRAQGVDPALALQSFEQSVKDLLAEPAEESTEAAPVNSVILEAADESASVTTYKRETLASLEETNKIFQMPTGLFLHLLAGYDASPPEQS